MSYTFTIGAATLNEDHGYYGCSRWRAEECEGPSPHTDEWEAYPHEGSPVRIPGYSQWHEIMLTLPVFRALFDRLRDLAIERHYDVIPVTEYVRDLDAVEQEAAHAAPENAARAYWFSRWSRHALALYGERACFETPGEWVNWAPTCACEESA